MLDKQLYYRPRNKGDNTSGSVHLSVRGRSRVSISLGIQIGCAFNSVALSTSWAFAVDHPFNKRSNLRPPWGGTSTLSIHIYFLEFR